MLSKVSRAGGHFIEMFGLRIVISILAVAGVFIIANALADAHEDTAVFKQVQCTFFGTTRPDCPAHAVALQTAYQKAADAQAATDIAILNQQQSDAMADLLKSQLDAIGAVEGSNVKWTKFDQFDEGPGDWNITVSTQYASLVPTDPNPKYGCYINLPDGSAGTNQNWWYKSFGAGVKDSKAVRREYGITDADWHYALSVCEPVLIEASDG